VSRVWAVQDERGATPLGGSPCAAACGPKDAHVATIVEARKNRFMSCPPSFNVDD
jgi:hypothetical protein